MKPVIYKIKRFFLWAIVINFCLMTGATVAYYAIQNKWLPDSSRILQGEPGPPPCDRECLGDLAGLRPRNSNLPVDLIRSRARRNLALDRFGDYQIVGNQTLGPSFPAASVLENIFAARGGEQPRITRITTPGVYWDCPLLLLDKKTPSRPVKRVMIFQHGHNHYRGDWQAFSDIFPPIWEADIPILLPLEPTDSMCTDAISTHLLHLYDLSRMGLLVRQTQTYLDYVKKNYPGAEIVFVGHSGGATLGYFTSVVDDRIDAFALDHYLSGEHHLGLFHCESVRGLNNCFDDKGNLRLDLLQAKRFHSQQYGYPDRDRLVSWILDSSRLDTPPAAEPQPGGVDRPGGR